MNDKIDFLFYTLRHDILYLTDLWSEEDRNRFAELFVEWMQNQYKQDMEQWIKERVEKWHKKNIQN